MQPKIVHSDFPKKNNPYLLSVHVFCKVRYVDIYHFNSVLSNNPLVICAATTVN